MGGSRRLRDNCRRSFILMLCGRCLGCSPHQQGHQDCRAANCDVSVSRYSFPYRTCRCGRRLDVFSHHRAACAQAGVWGRKGFALKCAAAQVCREAGARVATNVFVRDLDLGAFNGLDSRRLEVIADGLTLWRGAQLAIDTTLLSSPQ